MTASPSLPPPAIRLTPLNWVRDNLFSPWYNTLITIVVGGGFLLGAYGFLTWVFTQAQWQVIEANLHLFATGRYPSAQYWRLWVALGVVMTLSGISWGVVARNVKLFSRNVLIGLAIAAALCFLIPTPIVPWRLLIVGMLLILVAAAWIGQKIGQKVPQMGQYTSLAWIGSFLVYFWLISGNLGLTPVKTNEWGGLMLTVLMAVISIALCFPIGVVVALGRQSNLPVVRLFSVVYIEVIRGIPLIAILFMGQVMIPLFLPEGMRPDRILRAIIGLTLFSSAYLAENVRGGLQSIPRGQEEASKALGLNPPLTVSLIILPQAIKAVIPTIVGQFISLFQDTTLLAIVGLEELLGMSRSILANPNFIGRFAEVYLAVGVMYWVFCYAMSLGSRYVEKKLNTSH
ncbi:MAG: amino acid ABC transporter permease [Spirulina sp. DLM2.Bin59]|nr:MAG: amino acid ABC transporter permease [Spirulina sp. DLM2.Bin59]